MFVYTFSNFQCLHPRITAAIISTAHLWLLSYRRTNSKHSKGLKELRLFIPSHIAAKEKISARNTKHRGYLTCGSIQSRSRWGFIKSTNVSSKFLKRPCWDIKIHAYWSIRMILRKFLLVTKPIPTDRQFVAEAPFWLFPPMSGHVQKKKVLWLADTCADFSRHIWARLLLKNHEHFDFPTLYGYVENLLVTGWFKDQLSSRFVLWRLNEWFSWFSMLEVAWPGG